MVTLKTSRVMVIVASACLVLGVSGCRSLSERVVQKPTVELKSISLKAFEAGASRLDIGVEVENPNPFVLKVDRVSYEVSLGERVIAVGRLDSPTEVAARAKATVAIPLILRHGDLFDGMIDFLAGRAKRYQVTGAASVAGFDVPFQRSGEIQFD